MLTIEQCRQVLGSDCHLSDSELEALRDQLYALADITITVFLGRREHDRAGACNTPRTREKEKPMLVRNKGNGRS